VIFAVGFLVTLVRRRRKGGGSDGEGGEVDETADAAGPHGVGAATARAIDRSQKLERLRASGSITDATFHTERSAPRSKPI
jgi:hypothetical protein